MLYTIFPELLFRGTGLILFTVALPTIVGGWKPVSKTLCGDYVNVEGPMLRSFRKYAEPSSIPADTLLVRLAVAQHHRLPTRVLDWTVSPKVALHFATAEEEHYDKDGVVWCVDVRQVRDLLPMPLQSILADEHAFLFSVEMLPEVKTLKDLDAFGIKHGGFALFFEPPSLDARIVNQGAIMSVMPGARLCLNDSSKVIRKFIAES
jgi:hypothetical protein